MIREPATPKASTPAATTPAAVSLASVTPGAVTPGPLNPAALTPKAIEPEPATPQLAAAKLTTPEPITASTIMPDATSQPTDVSHHTPEPTPQPQPSAARTQLESLIATARFAEAETLFAQLPPEPDQDWYVRAGLSLARQRADHTQALAYATRLQALKPTFPVAFGAASSALRALNRPKEAVAVTQAGLKLFPKAVGLRQEAARAAEAADDVQSAYASWAALRVLQPKNSEGYVAAIRLSIAKRQPDITRTLLEEGLAAFPDDRALRLAAARNATRCHMWADAATHWNALTTLFPDDAPLAMQGAIAFIGPRAGRHKRMPQVFAQLADIQQRFPDYAPAYAATINALRETGRLDEAETLGRSWRERFPGSQDLAIACGRAAEDQGRHTDAIAILEAAAARTPPTLALELTYIRCLSLAGQDAAAERATDAALARFPQDLRLIELHVALATRRGDFAEALARAGRLAQKFPGNADIARLHDKLRSLQHDDDRPAADPSPAAVTETDGLAAFFTRFESLGSPSAGCEFGKVQRRFGADPLGLLRWANMSTAGLISALQNRFEGLGEQANTRILIQRASANHKEYYLLDDRYTYWTHTFIKADDAPADRVLKQSLRRLTFLRGKLLEDLAQAEKIFVFKTAQNESRETLLGLHDALSAYGSGTLLIVTLEDGNHPAGSVEMLRPGLFLGRAAMFMDAGPSEERGIDADLWRRLCEQVALWHDSRRPAPITTPAGQPEPA